MNDVMHELDRPMNKTKANSTKLINTEGYSKQLEQDVYGYILRHELANRKIVRTIDGKRDNDDREYIKITILLSLQYFIKQMISNTESSSYMELKRLAGNRKEWKE